jgi:predicted SnoaL-like aldol condensation-catalyzing enzyme
MGTHFRGGDSVKAIKIFSAFILMAGVSSMSLAASVPVTAAPDQTKLLASSDPVLAANKKLVYDFTRVILAGHHLDQTPNFLSEGYIQHNPNVDTGLKGFLDFFSKLGGPRAIPDTVAGLVAIQAEGDLVTFSFVNEGKDSSGQSYTTTWFDMFRVQNGKITEHWDCDTK